MGRPKTVKEALLGSLLLDSYAIADVISIVAPEDFFIHANAWIYEAIVSLHNEKSPSDFILVYQRITEQGHGDDVSPGRLTGLLNACPTSIHAVFYARTVKMLSKRRKIISLAGSVARTSFDLTCGMENVETTLRNLVMSVNISSLKQIDFQDCIDDVNNTTDWLWHGRIPYEEITAIGGAEGTGKTWLLLEIIRRCLNEEIMPDGQKANIRAKRILYIDAEDGKKTISSRLRNWQASGLIKDKDIRDKLIFVPYPIDGLLDFAQTSYQQDLYNLVVKYQPYLIVVDSWQASLLKSTFDEQVMPTFLFFKMLYKPLKCFTSLHTPLLSILLAF